MTKRRNIREIKEKEIRKGTAAWYERRKKTEMKI